MQRRHPNSTRTYTPFPYPTLFQSGSREAACHRARPHRDGDRKAAFPEKDKRWRRVHAARRVREGRTDRSWRLSHLVAAPLAAFAATPRSEEHTSELQSLMRISYAVFCLKKKTKRHR